jgi:superfamily II DNA or RNA helicase
MDCITRGNKPLQQHQKKFVESFIKSKQRGSIAIHGAGSGKTLLAVAVSKCYLGLYPDHFVVVITPASLLAGFRSELTAYENSKNCQYRYYTYAGFVREPCDCEDSLIIVDEAQNLKNAEGAAFKSVSDCAKNANKVLLLSATPIINSPYDIEPLMSIIHGKSPIDETTFNTILGHKKLSQVYFGCRLSFFENDPVRAKKYFPTTTEKYVPIVMNDTTLSLYKNLEKDKSTKQISNIFELDNEEKDLQSFFNGLRRISSSSVQKINFMIKFITQVTQTKRPNNKLGITQNMLDTHTDKFIIFTHFKTHGSNLIIRELKREKIPFGFIDGSVPKSKRADVVDQYVSGDIKVILISAAGATGLNLLETGYMFLVEPSWNESEVIQVMARANRYLSHAKLPKARRNVLIMKMLIIKPHEADIFGKLITDKSPYENQDESPSIDVKMVVDSNRKQITINKQLKFLESKIQPLEKCKLKSSELDVNKLFEMKKISSVPRITKAETKLLTQKPDPSLAKPQSNSHRTLKKQTHTNNLTLVTHIINMSGVKLLKYATTILFDVVSPVLVYRFIEQSTNVFAHVMTDRLTPKSAKSIRDLPRSRVVTTTKKYKLGVFNGYIDFETNSINKMANAPTLRRIKQMHEKTDVTIAVISWDLYQSSSFDTWVTSKNHKIVKYFSPLHMHKKEAEMVVLKIY